MEPPSRGVEVINESGESLPTQPIERAVSLAFDLHAKRASGACVLLTRDERIHELNLRFRSVDAPTDVLTFPSGDETFLGDVAISVPYATRQAAARGVPLEQELAFLAIHGALHLLGYDDETEEERAGMVDEMNRVAEAAGFLPDREWASLLHGDER
jgi:rRNA maturation RNase YbeY